MQPCAEPDGGLCDYHNPNRSYDRKKTLIKSFPAKESSFIFAKGQKSMDQDLLLNAANAWKKLCKVKYTITYGYKSNLYPINLTFDSADFYHLAGFPHARDIQLPRFNQTKVLDRILAGKITNEMLAKSKNYKSMIVPRLQALINMEAALDNDFFLYSYYPDLYPFYTSISADFLLAYHSDSVYFMFIVRNGTIQDFDFTFVSVFSADSRDYETNQRQRTILKKTKINLETGDSTDLFISDHLKTN